MTRASMPHSFALPRRKSLTSVIITPAAPSPFAVCATRLPIGPAPRTRTFFPFTSPNLLMACTATAAGSTMAPSSRLMPFGSFSTLEPSTAKYSEPAPVVWNPITFRLSQMWYDPCLQG